MRRIWGSGWWGCLKAQEPSCSEPRGHLRFCQNRGIRLVCRVWVIDLGALAEERVCGVQWPGLLVVGVLESWAGLVEVDGGEDSPLSLERSSGSGPVLEHPFSRWPREEGSGTGRRHLRPFQPHSCPLYPPSGGYPP